VVKEKRMSKSSGESKRWMFLIQEKCVSWPMRLACQVGHMSGKKRFSGNGNNG
jgi:hypothetical protein